MSSILEIADEQRRLARDRVRELDAMVEGYVKYSDSIPCGLKMGDEYSSNRERVMAVLDATEQNWNDWKWQLRNVVRTVDQLERILRITDEDKRDIAETAKKYRWYISPYYSSLMSREDRRCPIRKQSVPDIREVQDPTPEQPLAVTHRSPAPLITQYYPDRVILNVTNRCSMYCRHCLRRKDIGYRDVVYGHKYMDQALSYVRDNPYIRDILITGGDALTLGDDQIEKILDRVAAIEHVEIVRLGSRMPVVLPMRITDDLCSVLKKYDNLYLSTQYNHPKEVTKESKEAISKLLASGVIVRNQTVLLKGINSHPFVMKKLMHELAKVRVVPYYIFNCKKIEGIMHFRTTIQEGKAIVEEMLWKTSGFCVPRYIATTPAGKVSLNPDGLLSYVDGGIPLLRAGDGTLVRYE